VQRGAVSKIHKVSLVKHAAALLLLTPAAEREPYFINANTKIKNAGSLAKGPSEKGNYMNLYALSLYSLSLSPPP